MRFGLEENIIEKIIQVFESNSKVDKALVFGSRAKGNWRTDSDIDIAVKGIDITMDDILKMSVAFDEKDISYKIDLIDYNTVKEKALIEHIDRVGIELYSRWKEYKLGDIAEITSSKRIFYSEYVKTGVPFYRSKEIINKYNKQEIQTELFITEKKFEDIKIKFGVPVKDDILLTSVGTLGIPYLVNEKDQFYFKDGNLTWFRNINRNKIDISYLYIWLQSRIGKQRLEEIAIGSTQPALTISGLKSIDILLPNLTEQTTIATILSSLDDKIDLLHHQNKTLEQWAETLFRQWFVEEVDESWALKPLGKVFDIGIGRTPPRKEQHWFSTNPNDIKWVSIKDMGTSGVYLDNVSEYLTQEAVERFYVPVIPENTVLLSFKMTIGRLAITTEKMLSNEAIAHFKQKENSFLFPEFLYLFLKTYSWEQLGSTSSIVEAINSQMIKEIEMVIPEEQILNKFKDLITPYFYKIKSNQTQIRTLNQLRDVLLPKLMSGEVRVNLKN